MDPLGFLIWLLILIAGSILIVYIVIPLIMLLFILIFGGE